MKPRALALVLAPTLAAHACHGRWPPEAHSSSVAPAGHTRAARCGPSVCTRSPGASAASTRTRFGRPARGLLGIAPVRARSAGVSSNINGRRSHRCQPPPPARPLAPRPSARVFSGPRACVYALAAIYALPLPSRAFVRRPRALPIRTSASSPRMITSPLLDVARACQPLNHMASRALFMWVRALPPPLLSPGRSAWGHPTVRCSSPSHLPPTAVEPVRTRYRELAHRHPCVRVSAYCTIYSYTLGHPESDTPKFTAQPPLAIPVPIRHRSPRACRARVPSDVHDPTQAALAPEFAAVTSPRMMATAHEDAADGRHPGRGSGG